MKIPQSKVPACQRGALTGHVMTDAEVALHDELMRARAVALDEYRHGLRRRPTLGAGCQVIRFRPRAEESVDLSNIIAFPRKPDPNPPAAPAAAMLRAA
jgi:hypothetical protein